MSKWTLYVWEDVFRDYTPGLAFAIARNLEEALQTIEDLGALIEYIGEGQLTTHNLPFLRFEKPIGYYVHGGG